MAAHSITPEAHRENVRALAQAAGISEAEASRRLDGYILITYDCSDTVAADFFGELEPVLERTMRCGAAVPESGGCNAGIVIGAASRRSAATPIYVTLERQRCTIALSPSPSVSETTHPLFLLIAACYAAGAALHQAIGSDIPNPPVYPFAIDYRSLCLDERALSRPIDIGETYLAGTGAIGNGFLWAARHVTLAGTLHLVDDDHVSSDNLQRQIWFDELDLQKPKAKVLAQKAEPFLPDCRLVPEQARLQQHPNRDGKWLRRLIVAVDSRRARRELQNEFPGEVFDASTTDIQEIVLHYNRQPTELACMGCLYVRDEREVTQDESIAMHLGVTMGDVRTERISADAAQRIIQKHAHLISADIIGIAYDTLYKALCSSGKLASIEGEEVVAPFAFVSVLAGALLLLEVVNRLTSPTDVTFNEWRVSPWRSPFLGARRLRARRLDCECCGRVPLRDLYREMWGETACQAGV